MIEVLKSVWSVLEESERKRAVRVFMMVIALGIVETAGVASIMPFLAVATNPASIDEIAPLNWAFDTFGFSSEKSFLIALGVTSIVVLVSGAFFRLVTQYSMLQFVSMQRHSLATRLLGAFLHRPYSYFLSKNSSAMSKGILSESNEVVTNLMKPLVDLIAYGVIAILLTAFLIAYDPILALVVAGTLGGAYGLIYLSIREKTQKQGRLRVSMNRVRFLKVSEAFGGIKEVKLRGLEGYFLKEFEGPSRVAAEVQASNAIMAQSPKYLIEGVAFGLVMGIAVYLLASGRNFEGILPVLAAYALAGHRLIPALQNVYNGVVRVRFGMGALESLLSDLKEEEGSSSGQGWSQPFSPLRFRENIRLEGAVFTYPGTTRPALGPLDLVIAANTSVGFVGPTGAGKTTLVDLILGLLSPSEGRILIDGVDMRTIGVERWQDLVGYVPQVIYLADASIVANIAFGVAPSEIDMDAVMRAARAAQLDEFVEQLPEGYQTRVGERGFRLSGGQRQRIGIARALYRDPQVLVLDEGTSALDGITESAVMDAVASLAHSKTILLVAHRLSTVQMCDEIVLMAGGEIEAKGTYEELMGESELFRRMASGGTQKDLEIDHRPSEEEEALFLDD